MPAARGADNLTGVLAPAGLYVLIDPAQSGAHEPARLAAAAIRGGARVLQLRAKTDRDGPTIALGRTLRALTRKEGVAFVVNDRADLASLLEADALHLGQDDLPIEVARTLVPGMPIGLSTHSRAQAEEAVRRGADYVGFGPVFTTRSKENPDPTVGLDALAAVTRAIPLPVAAIGGITVEHAAAVRAAGARWIAVLSALASVPDPEAEARRFA